MKLRALLRRFRRLFKSQPPSPLLLVLNRYEVYPSTQIAAYLEFKDLQSLLLVCRAAQHSVIHEAYLKRAMVTIPPLDSEESAICSTFRPAVRDQLCVFQVLNAKDLPVVLKSSPRLTGIRLNCLLTKPEEAVQLGDAPLLERLELTWVHGVEIEVLAQLPHLSRLKLTQSSFFWGPGAFVHLQKLTLRETQVGGIAFVLGMPLLESLHLLDMRSPIDLSPLGHVSEAHRLIVLVMNGNTILQLPALANGALPSMLTHLETDNCTLRWPNESSIPLHQFIALFTKLELLSIQRTKLDPKAYMRLPLSCLSSYITMNYLHIHGGVLEMEQLARCAQLRDLNINLANVLPREVIAALRCLRHLRRLIMKGGRVQDVLEALPSLQWLHCREQVDWETKTSSQDEEATKPGRIRPHPRLRSIVIMSRYSHLHRLVPNIEYLCIHNATPPVSQLLKWRGLNSLQLHDRYALPKGYVRRIMREMPNLLTLKIDLKRVRWDDVRVHRPSLRKLTTLILRNSITLTVEAIFGLQTLTWLDITGWHNVEYAAALERGNGLPHLSTIVIDEGTSCRGFKRLAPTKLPALIEIFHPGDNCRWAPACRMY
ncbi:hypothetical protein Poli38472_004468 [Pythium oligandrum]|uniref:Uncharacterized protein n=1 Tax=Pythium oligandrum TaxID=41045 RepID=A0A8K1FFW9_PYTOL|nr:hypothetical protein Poli38472_004468 [Pythium oligandrum]|eukprot:TMW59399.1 hypothetical protein Poli38472_004468 [Pythium oligandrum]